MEIERVRVRANFISWILSIAAILVAAIFGYFNCQAANDASDQAAANAERISAGIDDVAANTSQAVELSRRIDANSAVISANTTAIGVSSRETAKNTRRIADQIEESAAPPTDLGVCRAGLEVQANEYCSWIDGVRRFEVYEDGAYSPWDTTAGGELNRATIKVDPDPPDDRTTFQARSTVPGVWEVLVAGYWIDLGGCTARMIVQPGQFCVERQSQQPFLVYATDEFVEGDNRPLYPGGYAVLFWWKDGEVPHPDNGRLHDQLVVSGDHFEAVRRSGASWEIVKAN